MQLREAGKDPRPEIMVPLVGSVRELQIIREEALGILAEVGAAAGVELDLPIGCMIELPRAALTAHRIAEEADFFSFGTNDLTQTTWGFSRDDVEGAFFADYLENGVLTISPFETLDADGVGALVDDGRDGRSRDEARACTWASAASTAATRSRSTSSTTPGWTTSRAAPSGCRSPGSRPAGPRP